MPILTRKDQLEEVGGFSATNASKCNAVKEGILAAIWCPTDEAGRLKRASIQRHLNFLKGVGVDGVLALGSTGEFIRMNLREREEVLSSILELAAPLPVIANLSSIRLDEVIFLGRAAKEMGAVGAAIMPAHFFALSQADLLEFLVRAAEKVDLPFYLYNFPELTGNRIALETVAAFADQANMAGIKQSGNEFAYHKPLIDLGREKGFSVFSGSDTRLPEVFGLGAAGCIGGLVNFVPELMLQIFHAAKNQRPEGGSDAAAKMSQVGAVVDRLTFPLNVAAGLEARGFDPGLPKAPVSPQSDRLYLQLVDEFKYLFSQWNLG